MVEQTLQLGAMMLLKLLFDISLRIRQVQVEVLCDVVISPFCGQAGVAMADSGERRKERGGEEGENTFPKIPS